MTVVDSDIELAVDMDRPVPLYPLVFLAEGDEVTIGRPDIDSYGIFPEEGAEAVRRLADGDTPRAVVEWFERTHDVGLDLPDLIATLDELELAVVQTVSRPKYRSVTECDSSAMFAT